MDWIDEKYISLISNRVERYKRINKTTVNLRCPLCGDSKTNKYKARGYIITKPIGVLYYCHNCHESLSLFNFLKRIDTNIAEDYKREKFVEKYAEQPKKVEPDISVISKPNFYKDEALKKLKRISQLDPNHPVKKYVVGRKIPPEFHYKLYYAPYFKKWVNSIIPEKFGSLNDDEPRLIIPFLDSEKRMFGFQGRSFKKDGIRYISIMLDESKPKMFGIDSIDTKRSINVVEGPIDSMFLDNCVAMAGSAAPIELTFPSINPNQINVVYDNEPRNKDIIKQVEKAIKQGYNVCIWPATIHEKDINEMVLNGIDVKTLVKENLVSGLTAELKLAQWKKI